MLSENPGAVPCSFAAVPSLPCHRVDIHIRTVHYTVRYGGLYIVGVIHAVSIYIVKAHTVRIFRMMEYMCQFGCGTAS